MAITPLLIEGFDVYPDVATTPQGVQARWLVIGGSNAAYATLVAGRYGGQALQLSPGGGFQWVTLAYPLYASGSGVNALTNGVAIRLNTPNTASTPFWFVANGSSGTVQYGFGFNSMQQPYIFTGGTFGSGVVTGQTVLATRTAFVSTGSWHYYELMWAGGVSGSLTLYIDGVSALTFSGNVGTLNADTIAISCGGPPATGTVNTFDDMFVITGSTRLGERSVYTSYVNANNAVTWTPLAGTNWQEVSETLCDGDTTYNSTVTAGNQDTFPINSLPYTPLAIDAVQLRTAARKTDGTTHILHNIAISGATTFNGADWALSANYLYDIDIMITDPNTSAAWTTAAVNALKIGYKLVS